MSKSMTQFNIHSVINFETFKTFYQFSVRKFTQKGTSNQNLISQLD